MSSSYQNSPRNMFLSKAPMELIKFVIDHNEKLLKDEVIASNSEQVKRIKKTILIYSREFHRQNFDLCLEEIKYMGHFNMWKKYWLLRWLEAIDLNDIELYEDYEPNEAMPIEIYQLGEIPDSVLDEIADHNNHLLIYGTVPTERKELEQLKKNIIIVAKEQHKRKFNMCLTEMLILKEFNENRRHLVLSWLSQIILNDIILFKEPDLNGSVSRKRPYE